MADAKYYPDEWSEYCKFRKSNHQEIEPVWGQFASRYRIAQAFQRVEFMQLSEKVSLGYSAGMSLLLSYSAFEMACKAINSNPNQQTVSIFARDKIKALKVIRKLYGKTTESYDLFKHSLTNDKLLKNIDDFIEVRHDNIQPLCAAVRHLIAHGHWTPTGSDVLSTSAREALENMARSLLFTSDNILVHYVESLKQSSQKS